MIRGVFFENIPLIQIVLAWGQSVQTPFVILDTGFTGDLQVTPKIAQELGLEITGATRVQVANGDTAEVPVALAIGSMEGRTNYLQVLISESMPLAGINFLSKFSYKAIFDCKRKNLVLRRQI